MRHSTHPPAANVEVDAFNAAFDELGFEWHWDRATLAELGAIAGDKARVSAWVSRHHPHLLKVYDADFIGQMVAEKVAEAKARLARSQGGGGSASHGSAAAQHSAFA
jgi:hypothetical protein